MPRKYKTKGEWRLRMPGTDQYLIPGWRSGEGMEVEEYLSDKVKAKIFDNELSAEVDRDRIADDPANANAGKLEVEGEPFGESKMKITKQQLAKIIKEEYDAVVSEADAPSGNPKEDALRQIVAQSREAEIEDTPVDLNKASAIIQVLDAFKDKPERKEDFLGKPVGEMAQIAFKLLDSGHI